MVSIGSVIAGVWTLFERKKKLVIDQKIIITQDQYYTTIENYVCHH